MSRAFLIETGVCARVAVRTQAHAERLASRLSARLGIPVEAQARDAKEEIWPEPQLCAYLFPVEGA